MIPLLIREFWDADLPVAVDECVERWPSLADYSAEIRSRRVDDPDAAQLLYLLQRHVEEQVDPELIYRSPGSPDQDENLMALDRILQLFKTKPAKR